jgi:predicted GNAT family acetyltransferase
MDNNTILTKIDESCRNFALKPTVPGLIWHLPIPGVTARISTIPGMALNAVGLARFSEENVDEGIQNVIKHYQQEKRTFGWVVGPTSQPANLGEHLTAAGFSRLQERSLAGMVLRDTNITIPTNPDILVKQVAITDWDANISIMTQALDSNLAESGTLMNALIRLHEALGELCTFYLAYVPEREEPVAFASSVLDRERSVLTLIGAATLAAYRGRGIYSTMVAKRLEDARAMGVTCAIIQAVKTTSAPICAKLGFETLCSLDTYAYQVSEQE